MRKTSHDRRALALALAGAPGPGGAGVRHEHHVFTLDVAIDARTFAVDRTG